MIDLKLVQKQPEALAKALADRHSDLDVADFLALDGRRRALLAELRGLLEAGSEHEFYSWPEWRRLRRQVLAVDNCECQECKRRGVYSKASIVHHVRHLRDRPDLALSVYDGDSRQLEAVCKRCHEELHPDSQRQYAPSAPPLTPERWD